MKTILKKVKVKGYYRKYGDMMKWVDESHKLIRVKVRKVKHE